MISARGDHVVLHRLLAAVLHHAAVLCRVQGPVADALPGGLASTHHPPVARLRQLTSQPSYLHDLQSRLPGRLL